MTVTIYHITLQTFEGVFDMGFFTDYDKVEEELLDIREENDMVEDDNMSSDGTIYFDVWEAELEI